MNEGAVGSWRKQFPITQECVYMDHARLGPIPLDGVMALQKSVDIHYKEGSRGFGKLLDEAAKVRKEYAQLIGASPEEVAISYDTTLTISTIANGIRWNEGDSVVIPEIEYPSNVFPWMNLGSRGVQVRRVPCKKGRVGIDDLLDACDSKTRVIAVSLVQFSNGYRTDIERLGEACRARKIYLVVDGAQGVGAIALNVHQLPIDALGTQSFKWLLGPPGVGWLYVRKDLINEVQPSIIGPFSVTQRNSFLDHRFELRSDAWRFESGVPNLHGIAAVGASIRLLAQVGISNVEKRIISLTDRLCDGLLSRGYSVIAPRETLQEKSNIVVFRHNHHKTSACYEKLTAAKVIVTLIEDSLRVSPHFYNTKDEIDQLLANLL